VRLRRVVQLCCLLFTISALIVTPLARSSHGGHHVVLISPVDSRYAQIENVLDNLLKTLQTPNLWGSFWNEKVRTSSRFVNYRFSEIAENLAKYLTDRSVKVRYKEREESLKYRPAVPGGAGETPSGGKVINLFDIAGRDTTHGGRFTYNEYSLAKTIFHELMHVHQERNYRSSDYEAFPTAVEPKLPSNYFNRCEFIDSNGIKAVMPPQSADQKDCVATYEVLVYRTPNRYQSTWKLKVDAATGRIEGTSEWTCCPTGRVDKMSGTINKDTLTITRDCSGQGAPQGCKQVFTSAMTRDGGIRGTWSGSFALPEPPKNAWRVTG